MTLASGRRGLRRVLPRLILPPSALLWCACSALSYFESAPRELPCNVPDDQTGAARICPEGFPWCSCSSERCARAAPGECETGFAHKDGTCLSLEETGSLHSSSRYNHPACRIACSRNIECDDGAACNGGESCSGGLCSGGSSLPDNTSCAFKEEIEGSCRRGTCAPLTCGDARVDPPDEQCDDGNKDNEGDACMNDCTWRCSSDADCNDDEPCNGFEQCDAGLHLCMPGSSQPTGVSCSSRVGVVGKCRAGRCVLEHCGNRILDEGEECDDGNASDNDGCLLDCVKNRCGDGFVWAGNEECDDGNSVDHDGCDVDCRWNCLTDEQCRMSGRCGGCDRAAHACTGPPPPDGEECDLDGDPATREACAGGVCTAAE